ncbi:imidazole glycerol phosphate synthase amidotransferase subunit [Vibrio ishigakensis]|uniref:Imidazole glycerol phosphate synthase amidotransferase subunit n=1 Tax=Vibrio ishigakensis TaxID=1481914 RepID=A0A0B8QA03_9VIBR|nr:imidazole glycerol phosphate synthase amidotransferase subunit [Vibrio ishigakensis]
MTSQNVVIIDTGCANVSSVRFAIERLGYDVTVSKVPQVVLAADKLFLPGVGTASEAMQNLEERNLIELVKQVEKPLLGICLGMQLLGKLSEEKGQKADEIVPCLGLCEGEVRKLDSKEYPLPHMAGTLLPRKRVIHYLKALSRASISISCTALPCRSAITPSLAVIMVRLLALRFRAATTMGYNSTQSARQKRVHN